jgi:hypothetical protein
VIQLHAKEIVVYTAAFTGSDGVKHEAVEINFNVKMSIVSLVFPSSLPLGSGSLHVTFQGTRELRERGGGERKRERLREILRETGSIFLTFSILSCDNPISLTHLKPF